MTLAQYKGQVVMINFWASWCGPCRQEMPLLDDIYKKYKKLGFTLLGVNVEPDSSSRQRLAEGDAGELSDSLRPEEQGESALSTCRPCRAR